MQSVIRARVVIVAAILANCMSGTVMAEAAKVWAQIPLAPGGSVSLPRLIEVSPALSPVIAAGMLATSPRGYRGVVLNGFAEDITASDRLKLAKTRTTYQSPWLDVGMERIKRRVNTWLTAYRNAGGTADFVIIRPPAALDAQRFAAVNLVGIRAIAADRRAQGLAAEMGLASVLDGATVRGRAGWLRGMEIRCDKTIKAALIDPVLAQFPEAIVACSNHGLLSVELASALGVMPRGGTVVGTADLVSLNPAVLGGGFPGVNSIVGRIRSAVASSSRDIVPVLPPKSVFDLNGVVGTSAASNGYWAEAAIHVSMSGVRAVTLSQGALASSDSVALGSVRAVMGANSSGAALVPIRLSAPSSSDQVIASGMQAGSTQVWRVTLPTGKTSANFQLADGSTTTVRLANGECGAWLVAQSPAVPVLNAERSGLTVVPEPVQSGSRFVLLTDTHPAAGFVSPTSYDSEYLIVYQNDADPQAMITGIIDPAKVIAHIRRIQATGVRSAWGVLDFENPFDEVLIKGPSDPRFAVVSASLVNTMSAVKSAFPTMQWTYYGFPHIPYHPAAGDWGRVPVAQRDELMQQYTQPYAAVLDSMDWFMPCAYDVYERAKGMPNTYSPIDVAEAEFRKARVESIVRHFARRNLPTPRIIPAVSPWFQPGGGAGTATWLAPIPTQEFIEDQLRSSMSAGASGFAIWGGMNYMLRVASLQSQTLSNDVAALQTEFRSALGAAYPRLGGTSQLMVSTMNWSDATELTLLGTQMNATLAEAIRACDQVASEFGLAMPPTRGTMTSQN